MISRFSAWVNTVNTTAFRILVSVGMALSHSSAVLLAMLAFGWEPSAMQMKVLAGDAGGILTMMGFDVLQFWSKRRTEPDYVNAKQGPSPVTVEAPSKVEVTGTPHAAPAVPVVTPPAAAPAPPLTRDD